MAEVWQSTSQNVTKYFKPASICPLTFYLKSYIIYDRNGENYMSKLYE